MWSVLFSWGSSPLHLGLAVEAASMIQQLNGNGSLLCTYGESQKTTSSLTCFKACTTAKRLATSSSSFGTQNPCQSLSLDLPDELGYLLFEANTRHYPCSDLDRTVHGTVSCTTAPDVSTFRCPFRSMQHQCGFACNVLAQTLSTED